METVNFLESLQRMRNTDFRVRLRANAVDPEVMSETGPETITVLGYLGHTSFANKNCDHRKRRRK